MANSAFRRSVSSSWLVRIMTTEFALPARRDGSECAAPSLRWWLESAWSPRAPACPGRGLRASWGRVSRCPARRRDRSTEGAAGFSRLTTTVVPPTAATSTIPITIRRISRFLPASLRCISIWVPVPLRHGACQSSFSVTYDVSGRRTDRREFEVFACGTDTYRKWGIQEVEHAPVPSAGGDYGWMTMPRSSSRAPVLTRG